MKSNNDLFETRDQYCVITEALLSMNGFKNAYVYFNYFETLDEITNMSYCNSDEYVKITKHYRFKITLENGKEYDVFLDQKPLPTNDTLVFDKFILLYKMELLEN